MKLYDKMHVVVWVIGHVAIFSQQQWQRSTADGRDRARRAAETAEQRNKRLRKQREKDRARRAAQTASERQATSQQRSTRERETMAAETPDEKERLQRMSTTQHERLAVETPEGKKIIADENQPAQKVDS